MEKILFFSTTEFESPILQYSGSNENDVRTLTGESAKRMYIDIRRKELIQIYGEWNKVPDFHKSKLSKLI